MKLMITAFGWNDSGGGTTVPRLAAKELARRGWDVTVFHAAVRQTGTGVPYELREWTEDGVRLIGVHNRPHGLFDIGNPGRELDDPPITAAFAAALDRLTPDVVHFHNLHNLGAALIDQAATRGLPSYFTTHNYWLVCPRAYLLDGAAAICPGPGDGARCATCVGSYDTAAHQRRLAGIRSVAERGLTSILAVSEAVRETLLAAGYRPELVDVVRQAMPHDAEIWEQVGRDRRPGRVSDAQLTVAFLGSAYPHKGPQLLVQAAQLTQANVRVRILGEVPERFAARLRELDRRGVVELHGAFSASEIGGLLRGVDAAALPSMWWDCAPLAAAECRAARLPLLVPRLGGLGEVIVDGIDGLTFDALSAPDLARQIDRLASEPNLLERLQSAIGAPPSFEAYVDELERRYTSDFGVDVRLTRTSTPNLVRWQGDHGKPTSLSIINDRVTERLETPVQRINRDGSAIDPPLPHLAAVEVRHSWPPNLTRPPAGRLAAIVPWEFGAVPQEWLRDIDENVDELWVPSEFVRSMYIEGGISPENVHTIPNGVDLDLFTPEGPQAELPEGTRFLFVGGVIWRKGPDVLLNAWKRAFAGRDDVVLVVKDFGGDGVYKGGDRNEIAEHAATGALPRVTLLQDDLTTPELAAVYRACDVLAHPYRGEGFAMPVLEAMACGLPVIVTAGGPTDEFCPPEAGWRIRSGRVHFPEDRIDAFRTAGRPWVLEPDRDHLVELLQHAAADAPDRRRRGARGRQAASALSWDAVAERYATRIEALKSHRPKLAGADPAEPFPLTEDVELKVLATPAWRGHDMLAGLLKAWSANTTRTTSACLYLLADPAIDGAPESLESRVLTAAAKSDADLDDCADINLLMERATPTRDRGLHAAVDVYVPLHAACSGHAAMAAAAGSAVVAPDDLGDLVGYRPDGGGLEGTTIAYAVLPHGD